MSLLIGIRGVGRRRYSARKFLVFTGTASVLMLLGILGIYVYAHEATGIYSFDITGFHQLTLPLTQQKWIFITLFAGFAVSIPLIPFHVWVTDAHTSAPTGASIILAAVLLKMGTYGIVRFCLPILPEASRAFIPMIAALSMIAIVYGAFLALAQTDWRRLLAYSSVAHMSVITLGLFAIAPPALSGSLLQQINHGISTGGAVPDRRAPLRTPAHVGGRDVRPSRTGDPGVRDAVPRDGALLHRAAGPERLRRHDSDSSGRVRGAPAVGGGSGIRDHPRCGLFAVVVSAYDVRARTVAR
jgi:hypothetical protein